MILPNFSASSTATGAIAGSNLDLASNHFTYHVRNPTFVLGGEHQLGRWKIDYTGSHSIMETISASRQNKPGQRGSQLTMRLPSAGWFLNYSNHETPIISATGARSLCDINSYESVQMNARWTETDKLASAAEANVQFKPETSFPLTLKSGVSYRRNTKEIDANPVRFNFAGSNSQLPLGFDVPQEYELNTHVRFPFVDASSSFQQLESNPSLWVEDQYYRIQ